MVRKDMSLTARDYAMIGFQAILKAVPIVGASLEHFIFGPLTEIRMQRIPRLSVNAKKLEAR